MKKKSDLIAIVLSVPPDVAGHICALLVGMANNKNLSEPFRHYCAVKYQSVFKKLPKELQQIVDSAQSFIRSKEGKQAMKVVQENITTMGKKMELKKPKTLKKLNNGKSKIDNRY